MAPKRVVAIEFDATQTKLKPEKHDLFLASLRFAGQPDRPGINQTGRKFC